MRAQPPAGGCENRRIVLTESEKVGVTFGMVWPHMARHRGIGNTVKPLACVAQFGACGISVPQSFLRASDRKVTPALADMAISSNQPRIASGREQVRFSPIENALRLRLLPFKQKVGALLALGPGASSSLVRTDSNSVTTTTPGRPPRLYQRLRFLRWLRLPLSTGRSVADQLS